ncbi:hypothetical protein BDZ91DRAFT_731370, partial [Kalaharituber pfeilii]
MNPIFEHHSAFHPKHAHDSPVVDHLMFSHHARHSGTESTSLHSSDDRLDL